jgi:hypothetical protein
MKPILSCSLAFMLLLAGPVAAEDATTLADTIIREHRLLTPKQIECMTLMERDDSTDALAKVGVYERHDETCGGDPEIAHRLFDLEIDRQTGAAQWDNNFPDMEMRPVPDGPTTAQAEPEAAQTPPLVDRLAAESCHVPADAERRAVLDAMRDSVESDLKQPVIFVIHTIRVCGPWGFVVAEPVKPDGGPIKWQSTVCKGDVSHLVGALTRKDEGGAWQLKEHALCPTDVAWEGWPEKYGAPQALFEE